MSIFNTSLDKNKERTKISERYFWFILSGNYSKSDCGNYDFCNIDFNDCYIIENPKIIGNELTWGQNPDDFSFELARCFPLASHNSVFFEREITYIQLVSFDYEKFNKGSAYMIDDEKYFTSRNTFRKYVKILIEQKLLCYTAFCTYPKKTTSQSRKDWAEQLKFSESAFNSSPEDVEEVLTPPKNIEEIYKNVSERRARLNAMII